MTAVWNGVLFGLLLAIFIGPVFFALIHTSIQKGFVAGVFMALGVALSDAFYLCIAYFGISHILNNITIHFWLGLAGGMIMVIFGIISIIRPVPKAIAEVASGRKRGFFRQSVKGFLLNGINPSVLIFWVGVVSMATINYKFSYREVIIFFAAIILTVLLTDVTKSFVAHRLRKLLSPKFMKIMNLIVGTGLILFGIRLLYFALEAKVYKFFE